MNRRWGGALVLLVCAAVAVPGVGLRHGASPGSDATRLSGPRAPGEASLPRVAVADPRADRLGSTMSADPAVADGVLFLLIAASIGRCDPADAHDLPKMAVLAGLPVLAIGGGADLDGATTRGTISAVIREIVASAPCRPFDVQIGSYRQHIDAKAYAAAFPDSYFTPDLSAIPQEFEGMPLVTRANDQCNRVAYAVLPLDEARPWQCDGMRASMRKRIRQLCRAGAPEGAALSIRASTDALPPSCQ